MKTNRRLKKIISIFAITALVLVGSAPYFAFAQPEEGDQGPELVPSATFDDSKVPAVTASSVVLMNVENGDIIYEKNAHQLTEPASVTKILTCMVALDTLKMDQVVTVQKDFERGGTIVGFEPGEKLTVEQVLYGMMLESGNDAAEVIERAAGGTREDFSAMLNEKAKECGALNTKYKNPNGMNENPDELNVTTAYDQAVVTMAAMKDERFRKIVSTAKYTIPKTNKSKARKLKNSNACLWVTNETLQINGKTVPFKYEGCTGVKTGYSTSAGGCFVGTAKRDNMELLAVVLKSPDVFNRFADAMILWDYGFKNYKTYTVEKAGEVPRQLKVRRGALAKVEIGITDDIDITLDKDSDAGESITTSVSLKEEKPTAPIKKGAVMGSISAYNGNGELIAVHELRALEKVEEGGPLSYIGIADEYAWMAYSAAGLLALIIIILLIIRRSRKPKTPKKPKPPKQPEPPKQPKPKKKQAAPKQSKPSGNAKASGDAKAPKKAKTTKKKKASVPQHRQAEHTAQPQETQVPHVQPSSRHIEPPLSQTLREASAHSEASSHSEAAVRNEAAAGRAASRSRRPAEQHVPGQVRPENKRGSRPEKPMSPRGSRTRAEKREIRKNRARARRRNARMKD